MTSNAIPMEDTCLHWIAFSVGFWMGIAQRVGGGQLLNESYAITASMLKNHRQFENIIETSRNGDGWKSVAIHSTRLHPKMDHIRKVNNHPLRFVPPSFQTTKSLTRNLIFNYRLHRQKLSIRIGSMPKWWMPEWRHMYWKRYTFQVSQLHGIILWKSPIVCHAAK